MDGEFLIGTPLFRGATAPEAEKMLLCLRAEERTYKKGEAVYRVGERPTALGLVLSGSVHVEHDDLWGNKTLLGRMGPGELFAETYACLPDEPMMVSVWAAEDAAVLLLDVGRLLRVCPESCPCHGNLIQNLLAASARKNLHLSRRMLHTAPKTIRGRLLAYLSDQSGGARRFDLPLDRQELADYLGVDRSALSHALGKLQKEGVLAVRKNHFEWRDDSWTSCSN